MNDNEEQYKFHSIKYPTQAGTKLIIYFKRVPNNNDDQDLNTQDNLYNQINHFIRFRQNENTDNKSAFKMDNGDVPKNRTLIITNFDRPFYVKEMIKLFKLNGPVRRVYTGTLRIEKKRVYVGLVVMKNEHDLCKCFEMEYFQRRIYERLGLGVKNEEKVQEYRSKLLTTYEKSDEVKSKWVAEAEEDGYEVVTDKHGEFEMEYLNPRVGKEWQGRRKRKQQDEQQQQQQQVEQVIEGYVDKRKKKSEMKIQKEQLKEGFLKDKQRLKFVKQQ